jgi:hypothetical protein
VGISGVRMVDRVYLILVSFFRCDVVLGLGMVKLFVCLLLSTHSVVFILKQLFIGGIMRLNGA